MREVFDLAAALEKGPLHPADALAAIRSYAFDTWLMFDDPKFRADGWQMRKPPRLPGKYGVDDLD